MDLIVVCADCLEARKLKKAISEFTSFKDQADVERGDNDMDENDHDMEMENQAIHLKKEAFVIWGRPEVPKLFA